MNWTELKFLRKIFMKKSVMVIYFFPRINGLEEWMAHFQYRKFIKKLLKKLNY